jgi:hypothetical protein
MPLVVKKLHIVMNLILTALFYLTALWLVCSILQAMLLMLIRVPVSKIQLFYVSTPLRIRFHSCEVILGWIPVGSYVEYDTANFFSKRFPVRLVCHFSSLIIFICIACICLSPSQGWVHFIAGFHQIAKGSLAPIDNATKYLAQWYRIANISAIDGIGILAAKMAAFSLLPLGGGVITQIFADLGATSGNERIQFFALYNAVLTIMIMSLWIFAALWKMFTEYL